MPQPRTKETLVPAEEYLPHWSKPKAPVNKIENGGSLIAEEFPPLSTVSPTVESIQSSSCVAQEIVGEESPMDTNEAETGIEIDLDIEEFGVQVMDQPNDDFLDIDAGEEDNPATPNYQVESEEEGESEPSEPILNKINTTEEARVAHSLEKLGLKEMSEPGTAAELHKKLFLQNVPAGSQKETEVHQTQSSNETSASKNDSSNPSSGEEMSLNKNKLLETSKTVIVSTHDPNIKVALKKETVPNPEKEKANSKKVKSKSRGDAGTAEPKIHPFRNAVSASTNVGGKEERTQDERPESGKNLKVPKAAEAEDPSCKDTAQKRPRKKKFKLKSVVVVVPNPDVPTHSKGCASCGSPNHTASKCLGEVRVSTLNKISVPEKAVPKKKAIPAKNLGREQKVMCIFCGEDHSKYQCYSSRRQIKAYLYANGRCFNCLSSAHQSGECTEVVICDKCGGPHLDKLCLGEVKPEPSVARKREANTKGKQPPRKRASAPFKPLPPPPAGGFYFQMPQYKIVSPAVALPKPTVSADVPKVQPPPGFPGPQQPAPVPVAVPGPQQPAPVPVAVPGPQQPAPAQNLNAQQVQLAWEAFQKFFNLMGKSDAHPNNQS